MTTRPLFKLISVANGRPLALLGAASNQELACFRHPDGTVRHSFPASNKYAAIHTLFEDQEGRALPCPSADFFVPLCDEVLALCSSVSWITWAQARLLDQPAVLDDWTRYEAKADIERYFENFQYAVASAHEVTRLLNAHAANQDARTMRDHPLTGYADVAALMTMTLCKVLCDPLGISGAVVSRKDGFDVRFDPHDSAWAQRQADYWFEHRDAMLRRYIQRMGQLVAKAPTREELARRAAEMLTEAAEAHLARTGQPRPAVLDNPKASWLEKMRAVWEGPTLH